MKEHLLRFSVGVKYDNDNFKDNRTLSLMRAGSSRSYKRIWREMLITAPNLCCAYSRKVW